MGSPIRSVANPIMNLFSSETRCQGRVSISCMHIVLKSSKPGDHIDVHMNVRMWKWCLIWYLCILVKISNYPLLYWWMNSSNFISIQLLKEWHWHRNFGKSLILAFLSFSSVSHIPYYINFRFNNGPNMSSILACFLCQFVILEACSCLKNYHDTVNVVSDWYQLDCLLVRSVIFRITSTSGLIVG